MKLTIERATLLRSLNHIQSVVERRNTIPILANVMLEADDLGVSLTATDMDISIVESVESILSGVGATTAPAHTLYDIVRKLPDGAQIELDAGHDSDRITLSAGRSRFTLTTLPTADFPTMSDGDLPHSFAVPADDLRVLVDRTRFAISTEETRYYLNGIYLHALEIDSVPVLRAVATDGHRLARVEMPVPEGAAGMPGIIIPRKTVNELRKLIDEFEGDVDISLSDTKIKFAFDGTVLTSKLIDGTFPDYEKVIPVNNDKLLAFSQTAFRSIGVNLPCQRSAEPRQVRTAVALRDVVGKAKHRLVIAVIPLQRDLDANTFFVTGHQNRFRMQRSPRAIEVPNERAQPAFIMEVTDLWLW